MNDLPARRTGAQLVVDALATHGADRVFCVPGESYLDVLDALYDRQNQIAVVTCRQEGGAAMMAEADGKLTGRPGICMVTRGPGATNASAGLHVAIQDSTPMILFIGQIGRDFAEREAFQEIDYRRMFAPVAKWVAEIDSAARVPEFVARAYATATAGRPGPVVLALPEDMLADEADSVEVRPWQPVEIYPSPAQMADIGARLVAAERPLLILGGSRWTEAAVEAVERFAAASSLPVAAGFRRQDRFDNGHPCYAGEIGISPNPKLKARFGEADLLIVLGSRLSEMATGGYTLLGVPAPGQPMVHIHPSAEELGRVYQADLAVNATPAGFAAMLDALPALDPGRWSAWREGARADYEAWLQPPASPGRIQMGEIVRWMDEALPDDTIFTNGAGNFATWVNRFHPFRRLGTQVAPTSGSMGYGFPAAIASKLRRPDRTVVCMAGDGDFLMTGQELATAVQFNAPVIVVLLDNGMYGTIRMHQERHFPARTIATELRNPDFAALARAYGAHGELVEDTAAFAPAFERARASGKPAILHVKIDPEAITPAQSLSQIRAASLAAAR